MVKRRKTVKNSKMISKILKKKNKIEYYRNSKHKITLSEISYKMHKN